MGNADQGQSDRIERYHAELKRYAKNQVPSEQQIGYDLFVRDLQKVREVIADAMRMCVQSAVDLELKFADERSFFMNAFAEHQKESEKLQTIISSLQKKLEREEEWNS